MATKRHSKTWEQQAKYYEVDNITEYMIETYLNGNISTYRELYRELKPAGRRLFISWLFHTELNRTEIEKNDTRNTLNTYDYGNDKRKQRHTSL